MIFLLKYWKYIGLVLAVLSALGALFYYGHTKYQKGFDKAQGECEAAKAKVINENVQIRRNQDRVVRHDDAALAGSMWDRTY